MAGSKHGSTNMSTGWTSSTFRRPQSPPIGSPSFWKGNGMCHVLCWKTSNPHIAANTKTCKACMRKACMHAVHDSYG